MELIGEYQSSDESSENEQELIDAIMNPNKYKSNSNAKLHPNIKRFKYDQTAGIGTDNIQNVEEKLESFEEMKAKITAPSFLKTKEIHEDNALDEFWRGTKNRSKTNQPKKETLIIAKAPTSEKYSEGKNILSQVQKDRQSEKLIAEENSAVEADELKKKYKKKGGRIRMGAENFDDWLNKSESSNRVLNHSKKKLRSEMDPKDKRQKRKRLTRDQYDAQTFNQLKKDELF